MTRQANASPQLSTRRAHRVARTDFSAAAILLAILLGCDVPARPPKDAAVEDGGSSRMNSPPAKAGTVADGGRAGHDAGYPKDSGTDTPSARDAGPPAGDAAAPECLNDGDCQDGVHCNGAERCLHGSCKAAAAEPCSPEHACDEATHKCECAEPNKDGDDFAAKDCDGTDCNDNDPTVYPGAPEVCDPAGVDEDCDPKTYGHKDADDDKEDSDECRNTDPKTHLVYHGTDCNDRNPTINRNGTETCDYADNDCDGFVDEELDARKDHGMWNTFYADTDHDLYGDDHVSVRGCIFGLNDYVLQRGDCDDTNPHKHPIAPELCNGEDDDCDNLTDAEDPDLDLQYAFPETDLVCEAGHPKIAHCPPGKLWCSTTVERGCDTDGRRLSSCAACNTSCLFSCGTDGCDEIAQLSLGTNHACAVTREGRAACWGRGADGRLGDDSTDISLVPKQVLRIDGFRQIAAGYDFSCAVAGAEGSVYCWGNNASGQLGGTDAGSFSTVPVHAVGALYQGGAKSVAAGTANACALLEDGHVVCWGMLQGSLVYPIFAEYEGYDSQSMPARFLIDDATAIAVGEAHRCALTRAQLVECWGSNDSGQLGMDRNNVDSTLARKVPGLAAVTSIAAGSSHTCALVGDQVYCWGLNDIGQLGRPSDVDDYVPKPVPGLSDVVAIAAGEALSCARTANGRALCWGSNGSGELGVSDPPYTSNPIEVPLNAALIAIAAGGGYVCAQTAEMQVFCWGANGFGQRGNGTASSAVQPDPRPIKFLFGSIP